MAGSDAAPGGWPAPVPAGWDPRVLLDALADGVVAVDADDSIVYANDAAARIVGVEAADLVGSRATDLAPAPSMAAGAGGFAELVRANQAAVAGGPVRSRVLRADGTAAEVELRVTVVDEPQWLALVMLRDLERLGPERPLAYPALSRASELLAETLDFDETLARIAALVLPSLADWCSIDLVEPDGTLRRVALTHAEPEKQAVAARLRAHTADVGSDHPLATVLRSGRPLLMAEVPDEVLSATAVDAAHLADRREIGFHSAIIVPLIARERTLGVMTLATGGDHRRYDETDLLLASDLAARAALALANARLFAEVQCAEQRFRQLVEDLDAVVWEADPDTRRMTFISQRVTDVLGYSVAQCLDEPDLWRRALHPDDHEHVVDHLRNRLRQGLPIDLEYRMLRSDGSVVWIRDVSGATVDSAGRAVRSRGFFLDVTDRKAIEVDLRYHRALLEAQNENAVDGVLIVSPAGEMVSYNQRFLDMWPIPPAVTASRSDAAALQSVLDKLEDPQAFLDRVTDLYARRAAGHDELALLDGRVFDRYGAPLVGADGTYFGYAWYVRDITEQRRAQRELEESGERFARLARTLQQSLLPPHLPDVPGLELAASYLPAGRGLDVGGDFYDVFKTGRRTWGLVIGDVCGKGAEAATVTALTRYTVRAAAAQERSPRVVLATLNNALLRQRERGEERFVTAVYGTLTREASGATVRLCCAGHPPPLVVRADGTVADAAGPGLLLGIFKDTDLTDHSVTLRAGDALVFYTDGVVEARAGTELFGDARLRAVLAKTVGASAGDLAAAVEAAIIEFGGGAPSDDVAILAVRVLPSADPPRSAQRGGAKAVASADGLTRQARQRRPSAEEALRRLRAPTPTTRS